MSDTATQTRLIRFSEIMMVVGSILVFAGMFLPWAEYNIGPHEATLHPSSLGVWWGLMMVIVLGVVYTVFQTINHRRHDDVYGYDAEKIGFIAGVILFVLFIAEAPGGSDVLIGGWLITIGAPAITIPMVHRFFSTTFVEWIKSS